MDVAALHEEFRAASLVDAEVKGQTVRGLAAVYEQPWSEALSEKNGYSESFARGAFRKALSRLDRWNVPLLWQHEHRDMLGTTKNGTLRLKDDAAGLVFEGDLPKNPLGEYVRSMVERGDANGVSVGMASGPQDSSLTRKNGLYHRTINNIHHLLDVSLTWDPSYPAAIVELRSSGFAALPLQALLVGEEAQVEDSAVVEAPASNANAVDLWTRFHEVANHALEGDL